MDNAFFAFMLCIMNFYILEINKQKLREIVKVMIVIIICLLRQYILMYPILHLFIYMFTVSPQGRDIIRFNYQTGRKIQQLLILCASIYFHHQQQQQHEDTENILNVFFISTVFKDETILLWTTTILCGIDNLIYPFIIFSTHPRRSLFMTILAHTVLFFLFIFHQQLEMIPLFLTILTIHLIFIIIRKLETFLKLKFLTAEEVVKIWYQTH
jgi:hypothetical protein